MDNNEPILQYTLKEVLDRIDRGVGDLKLQIGSFERRLSAVEYEVAALKREGELNEPVLQTARERAAITLNNRWYFTGPLYLAMSASLFVLGHLWR